jgi:hypothetical protein
LEPNGTPKIMGAEQAKTIWIIMATLRNLGRSPEISRYADPDMPTLEVKIDHIHTWNGSIEN